MKCVRNARDGKIVRLPDDMASHIVRHDRAYEYVSKEAWKREVRDRIVEVEK